MTMTDTTIIITICVIYALGGFITICLYRSLSGENSRTIRVALLWPIIIPLFILYILHYNIVKIYDKYW